jgi:hypothetical protein
MKNVRFFVKKSIKNIKDDAKTPKKPKSTGEQ